MRGLEEGTVLVRWMQVASLPPADVDRWRTLLDQEERSRADRFRFTVDRDHYVAAHAVCRTTLSSVASLQPAEWRFAKGPFGKPEIDPGLGLQLRFSLSHTRGLVAAAVCFKDDLGVDVETCGQMSLPLDAAAFLAPREVAALHPLPDEERLDMLIRLWTLKESFLKANGEGLARDPRSLVFALDPIGIRSGCEGPDDPTSWQFLQWRPTPRHVLAVALHRGACEPAIFIRHAVEQHRI